MPDLPSSYRVIQRWYRSLTPDGKVWCETSDRDEMYERSRGRDCTFQVMEVRQYDTPWERLDG